jgi:hypothetical protein
VVVGPLHLDRGHFGQARLGDKLCGRGFEHFENFGERREFQLLLGSILRVSFGRNLRTKPNLVKVNIVIITLNGFKCLNSYIIVNNSQEPISYDF